MPSPQGELTPEAENDPAGVPHPANLKDPGEAHQRSSQEDHWDSWKYAAESSRIAADAAMLNTLILQAELERARDRGLLESRSRLFRNIAIVLSLALGIASAIPVILYVWTNMVGSLEIQPSGVWGATVGALGALCVALATLIDSSRRSRRQAAEYQTALNRADATLAKMAVEIYEKDKQVASLKQVVTAFRSPDAETKQASAMPVDDDAVLGKRSSDAE